MSLPRSEAERTLDALIQRARVVVAIAVAAMVVIARQVGGVPEDRLARGYVVAGAFFLAVVAHELPARLAGRASAVAAGVLADLGATTIAVALLLDDLPLAPVALLWPLFTTGLATSTLSLLAVAAFATLLLFAVLLALDASIRGLVTASGWGALYFATAFAYAEVVRHFRRAQRATESALAEAASLAYATTPEQVAATFFSFLDALLDSRGGPAALLYDERGVGVYTAVGTRGFDPETSARLRVAEREGGSALAVAREGGVWSDSQSVADPLALAGALRDSRRIFIVPLRDALRTVGVVLVGAARERALTDEARRGVARVAAQAASALYRLRVNRLVEQQRAAMLFLLDVRRAGNDAAAIATWAARAAHDLTGARTAVFVVREAGTYRPLAAIGASEVGEDVVVEHARRLLDALFTRQLPVVVPDAANDDRFGLGPSLARGALLAVPVHGEGAALLVRQERAQGISSGDVELLIMLADQAALLLSRAHALGHGAPRGLEPALSEGRLGELASHFYGDSAKLAARVVEALRLAIEGNHPHLAGSGDRVARLAVAIAERLALTSAERDAIFVAGQLRDVGELGIERAVLERPGRLESHEHAALRQHPGLGETILRSLAFLEPAAPIVRAHHERYDGSGYPDGLRGEEIPLGARVLTVADAYCAMTSARPHRAAFAPYEALRTVLAEGAVAFDPQVVRAFAGVVGVDATTREGLPSAAE